MILYIDMIGTTTSNNIGIMLLNDRSNIRIYRSIVKGLVRRYRMYKLAWECR